MQYKIISPVHRNGELLEIGTLIDLKEDDAASLLNLGAIEDVHLPYAHAALTLNLTDITKQ